MTSRLNDPPEVARQGGRGGASNAGASRTIEKRNAAPPMRMQLKTAVDLMPKSENMFAALANPNPSPTSSNSSSHVPPPAAAPAPPPAVSPTNKQTKRKKISNAPANSPRAGKSPPPALPVTKSAVPPAPPQPPPPALAASGGAASSPATDERNERRSLPAGMLSMGAMQQQALGELQAEEDMLVDQLTSNQEALASHAVSLTATAAGPPGMTAAGAGASSGPPGMGPWPSVPPGMGGGGLVNGSVDVGMSVPPGMVPHAGGVSTSESQGMAYAFPGGPTQQGQALLPTPMLVLSPAPSPTPTPSPSPPAPQYG
ncbi:unnamed protein product [Vitrella brassicaformis CCMP3155]|uniref:Uncharacterized protein n=1 Tax=Vitrella brassicaformis (strain CCMP3155) TaxID=1169540 RepID=A0A0G4FK70_VITBC|nr:unnamed protein product [Vitrella brassicaformis CCMP3155]|eukprot:CEM13778.1 unnamed protein product [Vitrella brassicaformis CCMP3155]